MEDYPAEVQLTDEPGKYPMAEQYLTLANKTDEAFRLLVDYFSQQEEPTIILMFIFQVGGILNANFDQIMMLTKQMGNSMLKEYADVLDTFIYRLGVSQGRFSFAAAAGLFKSIVNFALLLGSNYVAGKFGEAQLF